MIPFLAAIQSRWDSMRGMGDLRQSSGGKKLFMPDLLKNFRGQVTLVLFFFISDRIHGGDISE